MSILDDMQDKKDMAQDKLNSTDMDDKAKERLEKMRQERDGKADQQDETL